MFSDSAVRALHRAGRGVPRLINMLAHKSLLLVFGQGADRVERSHVNVAVGDTPAAAPLTRAWWPRFRFTRAAD
jgi:MSHA biogenesis protein MshM